MLLVLGLGLAGCVVMRAPYVDERPRWRLVGADELDRGCVIARALVRRSGKQGIALAVQLKSRQDCSFEVTGASLALADGRTVPIPAALRPVALHGRSLLYAWLPLPFDNNTVWNDGGRAGTLLLDVAIAGERQAWRLEVVQQ